MNLKFCLKHWIIALTAISGTFFLYYHPGPDKLTHLFYFWSALILFVYTQETFELREETVRQAKINRLLDLEREWVDKYYDPLVAPKSEDDLTKALNFFEILAQAYLRDMVDKDLTMRYFADTTINLWNLHLPFIEKTRASNGNSGKFWFIDFEKLNRDATDFIKNHQEPDKI